MLTSLTCYGAFLSQGELVTTLCIVIAHSHFAAHGVGVGLGRCWMGVREVWWIETVEGMVFKSGVFFHRVC